MLFQGMRSIFVSSGNKVSATASNCQHIRQSLRRGASGPYPLPNCEGCVKFYAPGCLHDGARRYHVGAQSVYLSAPDGADARRNGRAYSLRRTKVAEPMPGP